MKSERKQLLDRLNEIQSELKSLSGQMIIEAPFEMQTVIMTVKKLSKDIKDFERGVFDMASIKDSVNSKSNF